MYIVIIKITFLSLSLTILNVYDFLTTAIIADAQDDLKKKKTNYFCPARKNYNQAKMPKS